jgi:hypothetical protein
LFFVIFHSTYIAAMNRLAQLLLKKSLDECTTEELQRITDKYPYFNAGHLLTAAKTNLSSVKKAGLYFHPVLLSHLINKSGNVVVTEKEIFHPAFISPADTTMEKPQEIINEKETVSINETTVAEPQTEQIIHEQAQPELIAETHPTTTEEPVTNEQPETSNQQPEINNEQQTTNEKQDSQPPTTDSGLSFEPYHTVDYFASQGIKIKLEENSPDKLTRQLKSFTEWLKTMKKLPDASANIPVNVPSEKKVEQLAETSITDSTVETEAMAEVWVKQGNPEKAIEIYRKLSLLEPSKSPYFASRISALKIN